MIKKKGKSQHPKQRRHLVRKKLNEKRQKKPDNRRWHNSRRQGTNFVFELGSSLFLNIAFRFAKN